ncbi:hypothetical protein DPMN_169658 [Dreissena polymorpha]|uniref:Uncharacterized protein n=1 Tax=Dreissena polymorpha TaxID=45954 RepID=A0A9D4DWY8_DREPO|nr:hypothetical protein DPMN_169658 [Dreissena polymorpha]
MRLQGVTANQRIGPDYPCQTKDAECYDPTSMIVRLQQCLALSLHHSPSTSLSKNQNASQEQTLCGLLAWF